MSGEYEKDFESGAERRRSRSGAPDSGASWDGVLGGGRTPTDAAAALKISVPRYYVLEARALRGLLQACARRSRLIKGEGEGAGDGGLGQATTNANGGGGGGFGTEGSNGGVWATSQVTKGASYGNEFLEPFTGGSGGGGGGAGGRQLIPGVEQAANGGGGGAGGGAVKLVAKMLRIASTGRVLSNGGVGGAGATGSGLSGGSGGSGSGGAIWLVADTVDHGGEVKAEGGAARTVAIAGGRGGVGRIRVDATELFVGAVAVTRQQFAAATVPPVGFFGP